MKTVYQQSYLTLVICRSPIDVGSIVIGTITPIKATTTMNIISKSNAFKYISEKIYIKLKFIFTTLKY